MSLGVRVCIVAIVAFSKVVDKSEKHFNKSNYNNDDLAEAIFIQIKVIYINEKRQKKNNGLDFITNPQIKDYLHKKNDFVRKKSTNEKSFESIIDGKAMSNILLAWHNDPSFLFQE